jgi:hypothetical protein
MKLTDKLYFNGLTFYFTGIQNNERVYESLDELRHVSIITPYSDYDGILIGSIDEVFRIDEEDDMLRYFDCVTGIEEE